MGGILCPRAKWESSEQAASRLGGPGLQRGAHLVVSPAGWEWECGKALQQTTNSPLPLTAAANLGDPAGHPLSSSHFFFSLIYLLQAALGVQCCTGSFSSCEERGLLFITGCGLLSVVAFLVVHKGFTALCCSAQAQLLWSLWDLPIPGVEPVSSTLLGGFFTPEPRGKPYPIS